MADSNNPDKNTGSQTEKPLEHLKTKEAEIKAPQKLLQQIRNAYKGAEEDITKAQARVQKALEKEKKAIEAMNEADDDTTKEATKDATKDAQKATELLRKAIEESESTKRSAPAKVIAPLMADYKEESTNHPILNKEAVLKTITILESMAKDDAYNVSDATYKIFDLISHEGYVHRKSDPTAKNKVITPKYNTSEDAAIAALLRIGNETDKPGAAEAAATALGNIASKHPEKALPALAKIIKPTSVTALFEQANRRCDVNGKIKPPNIIALTALFDLHSKAIKENTPEIDTNDTLLKLQEAYLNLLTDNKGNPQRHILFEYLQNHKQDANTLHEIGQKIDEANDSTSFTNLFYKLHTEFERSSKAGADINTDTNNLREELNQRKNQHQQPEVI